MKKAALEKGAAFFAPRHCELGKVRASGNLRARAVTGALMPKRLPTLMALLALALPLSAQEDEPPPPPKKDGVQITFIPPPLTGTVSLGIYDAAGKLVRTLHREATKKDFYVGLNGFITNWDGRDDAGKMRAPGSYSARGWMVGNLAVEGVAFHGNDWFKGEDSPRYTGVVSVSSAGADGVQIVLRALDGRDHALGWSLAKSGETPPKIEVTATIEDGKLQIKKGNITQPAALAEGDKVIAASVGFGDLTWAIVEGADGREVRAYLPGGEFLRRLAYAKDEPVPQQIAASQCSEQIFLIEENEHEQRLRALALGGAADSTPTEGAEGAKSTWKVVYQKRIARGATFSDIATALGRPQPPLAVPEVKLQTKLNPLLRNAKSEVRLQLATDAKGTVLKTDDGLPLLHLTDSRDVKWATFVREDEKVLFFEGDGAVVGEFKIGKPNNLMAFDAGLYQLRAPGK